MTDEQFETMIELLKDINENLQYLRENTEFVKVYGDKIISIEKIVKQIKNKN